LGGNLTAEAGVMANIYPFPKTVQAETADGTYYFRGYHEINTSTGADVDAGVEWATSAGTNSGGLFYITLGTITLVSGAVTDVTQYAYGSIFSVKIGGITNEWEILFV